MSGETLRDEGFRQVSLAFGEPGDGWSERARAWIESLPRGQMLTADDLQATCGAPFKKNAVGQVVYRAAQDDLIEPIGYRQSERESRRHSVIRVWRRL